jgi:hypothetical protein
VKGYLLGVLKYTGSSILCGLFISEGNSSTLRLPVMKALMFSSARVREGILGVGGRYLCGWEKLRDCKSVLALADGRMLVITVRKRELRLLEAGQID